MNGTVFPEHDTKPQNDSMMALCIMSMGKFNTKKKHMHHL